MKAFFAISVLLCLLAVLGVLIIGIVSMIRGGEFNEKYGNRLMRLRVGLQGLALLMLALAYLTSKS